MPADASPDELHRLAVKALNRGDLRGMAGHCQALLGADPAHADAWFLLSIAAEASRDLPRALALVEKACGLVTGNAEYLAQQAKLLLQLRRPQAACEAADAALAAGARRALTLDTLGVVFTRLGEHQRAAQSLREAVALAPGNPQFHFNLASAEQFRGDLDSARRHYQEAIRLQPGFARAWWSLTELEKNAPDPARSATLEKLFGAAGENSVDRLYLGHAVARVREQAGDYAGAFAALQAAKAVRRDSLHAAAERDSAMFDVLQRHFSAADTGLRPAPQGAGNPLFIVGMPRSGTTLVEQMLAAHPAIDTFGELQDFPHAVRAALANPAAPMLDESVVASALAEAPEAIASRYRQALGERSSIPAPGIRYGIDKLPLNFLYLGFILRALPAARIVLVRRHPLDTCLSNFRQLFAVDFSYYDYACSLQDTARYYLHFERLCRHWQTLYGRRIHTLDYEELVAAPRATLEGTLAYLDLPWDDACLAFHQRGGVVTTASTVQVREPLYASAVGRWKRYEKELAPARAILEAAGIPCD